VATAASLGAQSQVRESRTEIGAESLTSAYKGLYLRIINRQAPPPSAHWPAYKFPFSNIRATIAVREVTLSLAKIRRRWVETVHTLISSTEAMTLFG
jgi:hypothetical protein